MKPMTGGHSRLWKRWRERLRRLRTNLLAIYLASRDPATPWAAKIVAGVTAAYAFSPIDLIPDFIPILGWLDDLLLVPLGIWLALKLIPSQVMARSREAAKERAERPVSYAAACAVVLTWCLLGAASYWLVVR